MSKPLATFLHPTGKKIGILVVVGTVAACILVSSPTQAQQQGTVTPAQQPGQQPAQAGPARGATGGAAGGTGGGAGVAGPVGGARGQAAQPQGGQAVGQRGQRGRGAAGPRAPIRRLPDGKPDISGFYSAQSGGANYGLERNPQDFLTPSTQGIVVDPPDGKLPSMPWTRAERIERELPHRGYDDPTAHCFVAGVPRSMYTPSPYQILQPPGYVILLFERMSWRQIPLDDRKHLPDNVRLWQGDSIGRWEGDTLVVETTNLNGKAWLNERGDVLTHAAHIVERFIPVDADRITYRATVTDPLAYTAPWTIEMPLNRQQDEILEVACHEDNGDLQHLKDVKDEYRAKQKAEKK